MRIFQYSLAWLTAPLPNSDHCIRYQVASYSIGMRRGRLAKTSSALPKTGLKSEENVKASTRRELHPVTMRSWVTGVTDLSPSSVRRETPLMSQTLIMSALWDANHMPSGEIVT